MIIKKSLYAILFILLISLAYCVPDIEVEKNPVNQVFIKELRKPAVFDLTIRNLGDSDTFEIYSLSGIDISPKGNFVIEKGGLKAIRIEVFPEQSIIDRNSGFISFGYKIRGQESGIKEDKLEIKLINLKDVFEITPYNIAVGDSEAIFYVQNNENIKFKDIDGVFSSAFFNMGKNFSLDEYGKKEFRVELDKNNIAKLIAGPYVLTSKISVEGKEVTIEKTFKFKEKSDISTSEKKSGFLIINYEIEKTNDGNLPIVSEIQIKKNVISRLFTTFSSNPNIVQRKGFNVYYTWQREIKPSEIQRVTFTTNWLFPVLVIVGLIVLVYLFKIYTSSYLNLKKKVVFVKTKGGEFALKVILTASANKYVENIKIIDKLPPLVKVYEKYGALPPTSIDERNRRLEWQIENLNEGEERVFSYIIYSKVGVMGRFALPMATAVYERDGEIKEIESNKVFFISEQRERAED